MSLHGTHRSRAGAGAAHSRTAACEGRVTTRRARGVGGARARSLRGAPAVGHDAHRVHTQKHHHSQQQHRHDQRQCSVGSASGPLRRARLIGSVPLLFDLHATGVWLRTGLASVPKIMPGSAWRALGHGHTVSRGWRPRLASRDDRPIAAARVPRPAGSSFTSPRQLVGPLGGVGCWYAPPAWSHTRQPASGLSRLWKRPTVRDGRSSRHPTPSGRAGCQCPVGFSGRRIAFQPRSAAMAASLGSALTTTGTSTASSRGRSLIESL